MARQLFKLYRNTGMRISSFSFSFFGSLLAWGEGSRIPPHPHLVLPLLGRVNSPCGAENVAEKPKI